MTRAEEKSPLQPDTALQGPGPASAPRVPALRPRPPAPPDAAARRRPWRWSAAGLLLLALAGGAGFWFWNVRPLPVLIETVAPAPVTRVLAVNGRIAAVNSVDVRSVVTGSLVELSVAEGDIVAVGQVLARVDAAAQTAAVRQAVAGLDAALVAQARATEALDRASALGGAVARIAVEAATHDVESAAQEVARQTALLDQARAILETHTIRAPVVGTVLTLDAERGQVVGPAIPLLTLADLSDLVVEADVDEGYATQIVPGLPAILQLAGETQARDGHVSFVSSRVDVATGGLAVRIAFAEPVTAPVGLTVATNIVVDRRDAALTVPRTALVTGPEGQGVFVVAEGVARLRPVTVVEWPAARLIVTQGLSGGEAVILDATGIADGQAVAAEAG